MEMEDNIIADGSVETPTTEELLERLKKAEAKIVEMKKASEIKPTVEEKKEETVDLDKKINELLEAKLSALNSKKEEDKYETNQETTNSMSMSGSEHIGGNGFNGISLSDFDKMTPNQKREYITQSTNTHGEVIFI